MTYCVYLWLYLYLVASRAHFVTLTSSDMKCSSTELNAVFKSKALDGILYIKYDVETHLDGRPDASFSSPALSPVDKEHVSPAAAPPLTPKK